MPRGGQPTWTQWLVSALLQKCSRPILGASQLQLSRRLKIFLPARAAVRLPARPATLPAASAPAAAQRPTPSPAAGVPSSAVCQAVAAARVRADRSARSRLAPACRRGPGRPEVRSRLDGDRGQSLADATRAAWLGTRRRQKQTPARRAPMAHRHRRRGGSAWTRRVLVDSSVPAPLGPTCRLPTSADVGHPSPPSCPRAAGAAADAQRRAHLRRRLGGGAWDGPSARRRLEADACTASGWRASRSDGHAPPRRLARRGAGAAACAGARLRGRPVVHRHGGAAASSPR